MSDGVYDQDQVKLVKMIAPQPSRHPDERMNLTLGDMRPLFQDKKKDEPSGPG